MSNSIIEILATLKTIRVGLTGKKAVALDLACIALKRLAKIEGNNIKMEGDK